MSRPQRVLRCLAWMAGPVTLILGSASGVAAAPMTGGTASGPQAALTADLFGVSAVSPSLAWAVGAASGTVIMRWNGKKWTKVKSPSPHAAALYAVAARSRTNAWADGIYTQSATSKIVHSLIVHWGGKTWSVVRSPLRGAVGTQLDGIAADSASDAWAVGVYCPLFCINSQQRGLAVTLRWNGSKWAKVAAPSPCTGENILHSVAVTSRTAAWAVGECDSSAGSGRPLILRWNGKNWSVSPLPRLDGTGGLLNAVSSLSRNNAWAVGVRSLRNGFTPVTLTLHWNGRKWSRVPSPNPGRFQNYLTGVSMVAGGGVWAAGYAVDPASSGWDVLTLHWNGSNWMSVPATTSPSVPGAISVSADSPDDAWVTGLPDGNACARPLLLHWNGSNWTQNC